MLNEFDLVPFSTSRLPEGKTLVFAPHPDDETFGLGGTILKLVANSQPVEIVLMTNGDKGGDVKIRAEEFQTVTQRLGVTACHYLNMGDREVQLNASTIEKVVDILAQTKPDNVFFPSPLEYHIDHRATAAIVWDGLRHTGFSGKAFSYEIGNQSPANILIDITDVIDTKKELMTFYKSQLSSNNYPEKIVGMNRLRSYTLPNETDYAEAFFCYERFDEPLLLSFYRQFSLFDKGIQSQETPFVSVLIRTKNRPGTLKNALISVKKQTYPFIELVCLNDGGVAVDDLIHSFQFAKTTVKNNDLSKGRAGAANDLLDLATSDFCIFLDDDDTFDPNHIENLVNILTKNPNVMAAYSGIRVGNESIDLPEYNQPFDAALLRRGNYIPIHAVLFSKKLVERGCRFDESFEIYEDWDFWLQVSQQTEMYHCNKISATYNIHGDSGAGQSGLRADEQTWKLKIYDKWSGLWTAEQLDATFHAIHTKNSQWPRELNALKQLNKVTAEAANKDQWFKSVLNTVVTSHDESRANERTFSLKSARNYFPECQQLFEEVFKQPMTPKFWDWKYSGNHWRNVCAMDRKGKIIGFYGAKTREILAFGEKKRALQPCDIMISAEARGGLKSNSPFYVMFNAWRNLNLPVNSEFYITYGFPNDRHFRLGKALGLYHQVDKISQVNWNLQGLKKMMVSATSLLNEQHADEVNNVWQAMAADFSNALLGDRGWAYLKQRYLNHPVYQYGLFGVRNTNNQLIGVFVIKEDGDHIKLMDIIAAKDAFSLVISSACHQAHTTGASILTAWITNSHLNIISSEGANITHTDIVVPMHSGAYHLDVAKVENRWFLMYGDSDFI